MRLMGFTRLPDGTLDENPRIQVALLNAWEKAQEEAAPANRRLIGYWLTKFMASEKFLRLGKATQEDYRRYIEVRIDPGNPKSKATRNGIRHAFGDMLPTKVTPRHIRRYMDYWAEDGKETTANRHLTCLQTFFKWLRQYVPKIVENPADGIIRFPEKKRQVYITDAQYIALLDAALNSTTPWFFAFMELAYLCGLRLSEVSDLNIDDICTIDGTRYLEVRRKKGSRGELIEISERLQAAIDAAISLHPKDQVEPLMQRPLVRNTRGQRITRHAVQKAVMNMRAATGIQDIRIHDLKKKAGSEGKDLGHKTARMRELYNLLPEKGKATR